MRPQTLPAVTLVLLLAIAHIATVGIFLKGFLLTRLELPNVSVCRDPELSRSSDEADYDGWNKNNEGGCWTPKAFDRAVVVIVDALRYDFVFGGPHAPRPAAMPKMLRLLDDAGPYGAAFRFVADTPTITMSRLKAMLTGGLPTFLDIGQSFSAAALGEDNLLGQLSSAGARVVVMGDDTWAQLASPSSYHGCHTFPSFDVHDLHTVDDGVWHEVWPYLRPRGPCPCGNSTHCSSADAGEGGEGGGSRSGGDGDSAAAATVPGWEVLVAHYLGVDHAGHTYGGNSVQMHGKLQQMDEQISLITEALMEGAAAPDGPYHRTLLLVMGDHGQTLSGDHGGGSDEERDSVLLAFNIGAWRADRDRQRRSNAGNADGISGPDSDTPDGSSESDDVSVEPQCCVQADAPASNATGATRDAAGSPGPGLGPHGGTAEPAAIPQIDLTPSLALLLGLPIPFGNLGKLNRQLWQLGHRSWRGTTRVCTSQEVGDEVPPGAATAAGGVTSRGAQRTRYLDALRTNAVQVDRYLTAYAARGGLPATELGHCRRLLAAAQEAYAAAGAIADRGADTASSPYPAVPDTDRQDASAQAVPKDGKARAEAAFEGFLEAAGVLARRKFTRFNLPFMMAGALLCVVACLGLHSWMLIKLWCGSGGRAAPAAAAVITHPESAALVGLVALHAFGLFSAGWIQGEGRLHCYSLAAFTVLLWFRAAVAVPSAASGSGQPSGEAASMAADLAAAAAAARKAPSRAAFPSGRQSAAGAASRWLRRQLWLLTLAAAALGANITLQRYSLIDRWGSDPHDKRQLAAAGAVVASTPEAHADMGASPGVTGAGAPSVPAFFIAAARRAVITLLPLLLLPLVLQAVAAPGVRQPTQQLPAARLQETTPRHQRGRRRSKPQPRVPVWTRAVFCHGAFVLVAFWWLLQLLQAGSGLPRETTTGADGGNAQPTASAAEAEMWGEAIWLEQRLRQGARAFSLQMLVLTVWDTLHRLPLVNVFVSEARQQLAALLRATAWFGPQLWAAALQLGLRWPPAAAAARVAAGAAGAVWKLPLRLLLPRLVYALTLAALGRLLAVRCRLWLHGLRRTSKAAADKEAIMGPAPEDVEARHSALLLDASFCSMTSSTAVLALLLGPRGPAVVLLLVVQGCCLIALLLQKQPAERHLQPAAATQPATAPPPRRSDGVAVVAAAAGCLLSLLGGQAFFLTGHFCEFSGLQYDSPFVGFDHMTWAATPLLFWINSFGGIMLTAMALPLVAAEAVPEAAWTHATAPAPAVSGLAAGPSEAARGAFPQSRCKAEGHVGPTARGSSRPAACIEQVPVPSSAMGEVVTARNVGRQALVWVSTCRSLALTVAVLSAGIQRHHVVVWALFAPKLVFEVCFAAAAYMALTLAALGLP